MRKLGVDLTYSGSTATGNVKPFPFYEGLNLGLNSLFQRSDRQASQTEGRPGNVCQIPFSIRRRFGDAGHLHQVAHKLSMTTSPFSDSRETVSAIEES